MAPVETRYDVPGWGAGELWRSDGVVLAHDFRFGADAASDPSGLVTSCNSPRSGRSEGRTTACNKLSLASVFDATDDGDATDDALVRRFEAFLSGEGVTFQDIAIDLAWATPFQRALAEELRAVPRGDVVSYGELAALAGRPGAARAAGAFCASNRYAFVVPCHRVVGANGVGGYGSAGLGVKRRLLALEGIEL